jgi:hypothetical protein
MKTPTCSGENEPSQCISDVQSFGMQIICTQRNDHVINILPMSHTAIQQ